MSSTFSMIMDISQNQPQQAKYHKLTVLENAVSMCRYTLCNDLYVIDLFNDLSVGASTMLSSWRPNSNVLHLSHTVFGSNQFGCTENGFFDAGFFGKEMEFSSRSHSHSGKSHCYDRRGLRRFPLLGLFGGLELNPSVTQCFGEMVLHCKQESNNIY